MKGCCLSIGVKEYSVMISFFIICCNLSPVPYTITILNINILKQEGFFQCSKVLLLSGGPSSHFASLGYARLHCSFLTGRFQSCFLICPPISHITAANNNYVLIVTRFLYSAIISDRSDAVFVIFESLFFLLAAFVPFGHWLQSMSSSGENSLHNI